MITKELVKECLEILDLKFSELESGAICVSFFSDDYFPYEVVTIIRLTDDGLLTFSSRAIDYHPQGDLLELANRHNCRAHSPCCFIDSAGDVVMDRSFQLDKPVSPHYILEDVIKPGIYLPLESFACLELSDSMLDERNNSEDA